MNVILKITTDSDCDEHHDLTIEDDDGKEVSGCSIDPLYESPGDAIIGRCLIDGNNIIEYMELAYQAGKQGEEFNVIRIGDEDDSQE
jgi:hypothetical protein